MTVDPTITAQLNWLDSQQSRMEMLTERWANINSGSYNLDGLRAMRAELSNEFQVLEGIHEVLPLSPIEQINAEGQVVSVPMAEALSITKRPEAPIQILLVGHMDTVYGVNHSFQKVTKKEGRIINGPGVADLKGGLVVMLHALHTLENYEYKDRIGWQVLLNPDEEIGSIASDPLLKEAAIGKNIGLVYEPALADGTLAGARKGSGNFTITVRGRAAHAGRNPEDGRNAIVALAELTQKIFALNGVAPGVTINPGKIEGGGALNVVPDLAILRFNIRTQEPSNELLLLEKIQIMIEELRNRNGFSAELHGHFTRSPKPLHPRNQMLFDMVLACGAELGIPLSVKPSGGCCDGNNLWKYGLPNVDTLGVRGAHIHSSDEIMMLDSLAERAKLSALLLLKLANGQLALPENLA